MNDAPILILQMQRMGDLLLSFPLLERLLRLHPGHPLWVVGEEAFYRPLLPLSPEALYFSYGDAPRLVQQRYHAVINLSHRPEAAALAGKIAADSLVGPWRDKEGQLHIKGAWQLYRASISHNNRYNLYHWANLNLLDSIPPTMLTPEVWGLPAPRPMRPDAPGGARIGLFLGASQPDKHPEAAFWSQLADLLLRMGYKPALLGGEAEKPLGLDVAARLKAPSLNLCGRFSIQELAAFIAGLDLCICPDTGPMHIAVQQGTPVLNLSLGPVNPWETGPFFPGHHVLHAALDCIGCWNCTQDRLLCRDHMRAPVVARVAQALLSGADGPALVQAAKGLELRHSARDAHGLYRLHSPDEGKSAEARLRLSTPGGANRETRRQRLALSRFWRAWFGHRFGIYSREEKEAAWITAQEFAPETTEALRSGAAAFALGLTKALLWDSRGFLDDESFWKQAPTALHPLTGYMQMYIQNELASREALAQVLEMAQNVAEAG
jgi:ADP-heptose:LPS heptosyltransferase